MLIKDVFMLSVRISSYGCTREVWRAGKMRKSCSRRIIVIELLTHSEILLVETAL